MEDGTSNGKNNYLYKELQQRVQQDSELFEWIQKAALDGLWYWDLENPENEYMSPEFKALFGYTDDEVPNKSSWWQDKIYPEDKVLATEAFYSHINDGKPYNMIVRYYHKNGSTVWVRCRGTATFNSDGKPVRMLGAHNDLTELMTTQEELQEKKIILDMLCDTSLDGYWDWNMQTGYKYISKRWKQLLGYDDNELENRVETWESLLLPGELCKAKDALQKHLKDGAAYNVVLRYHRKDGTIAHMLSQGVAQKDVNTGVYVRMFGTHTDVSYLEEARMAREANEAKSLFLATMSHEIRTPLNAVLGMAQALMATELTNEQLDCVITLKNSGSHLLSLINDVLDFSQIESGALQVVNEPFDVQKTTRDVTDVLLHSAIKKNISLTFDTHLKPGSTLNSDSERINQILFNLIGNGIKFTSNGKVSVSLQKEVRNETAGVLFSIHDTGCGISPEHQHLIFEDFAQANNEIRKKFGGSGLGLSISKRLVNAMNGTICVESTVGIGSTFYVWIPGLMEPDIDETSESGSDSTVSSSISNVILYEENAPKHDMKGSLSHAINATGRVVERITNVEELETCITRHDEPHAIVMSSNSIVDGTISDRAFGTIQKVKKKNENVLLIEVGKSFHHNNTKSSEKSVQQDIIRLRLFPTSDEFNDVFSATIRAKPTIESRVEKICRQRKDKPLRVLLVEDNKINQKVIRKLLSRLPCNISVAVNGVEAVEMVSKQQWDLIFMDCIMPEMDGFEATQIIRQFDIKTPIVALTANATTKDRDKCFQAGMCEFLSKPVSFEALCSTVDRVENLMDNFQLYWHNHDDNDNNNELRGGKIPTTTTSVAA